MKSDQSNYHQNSPDTFPNLHLSKLLTIAKRWVRIYSEITITRITLYTHTTTTSRLAQYQKGSINTRYVVVFEFSDIGDKKALETLRELRADTEAGSLNDPFKRLIPNDFIDVYKDRPAINESDDYLKKWPFLNEWLFLQYTESDWESIKANKSDIAELGIMVDEPHWVLFDATEYKSPSLQEQIASFIPSPDYRSINCKGQIFTLTAQQAQVIKVLHEAYKQNIPVSVNHISGKILGGGRWQDTFKSNKEAQKVLIISKKKGFLWLNL